MKIILSALFLALAVPASAQDAASDIQALLGDRGLLHVARTEAAVARAHVKAALRETDLAAMKAQVAAAVHAIEPGLRPALSQAVTRLQATQGVYPGDDDRALRATAASTAAQTALMRTDDALTEARAALAAPSTSAAIPALVRLDDMLGRVIDGQDTDGNGEITWNLGEGGIQQAWSFTRQMAIAEGLELAETPSSGGFDMAR